MYLIRSGAIAGYQELVSESGCNAVELLARVGLTPAQLRDPNTYISYGGVAELLEHSARACGRGCFGLALASRQDSSVLGDMLMSAFGQPTLQRALDALSQHLYLHARGVDLQRQAQGEYSLVALEIDAHSELGLNQLLQLSVGQVSNFIVEALDLQSPLFPLLLRQAKPPGAETELDSKLLSRIQFGAAIDGVRLNGNWMDSRPRFDEAAVETHLQNYLASLQRQYPDQLGDQVRALISQFLPSNECSVERVAASLDLHPRVLQQRLKEVGVSYGALLREVRCDLAQQHLRYPNTSITELALRLGYADVSVFSRSFRQWTGLSPRQWQRQQSVSVLA